MKKLQDLSSKIENALKGIIPKDIRFVLVLADQNGEDMSIAPDLSDKDILDILTNTIGLVHNDY